MIYLDNNATTPLDPSALEAMLPFLREHYGNASSGYLFSRPVKKALASAREQVARLLGCEPGEIVFTCGGTEADNAAIFSATEIHPEKKHIITAATEHDAVLNYCAWLEETRGYEITRLTVGRDGRISLAELEQAIRPGATALISLMHANNETGVVAPLEEAAALAASHEILFHTDAVQVVGKIPLNLRASNVHYLALSGHKLHAPKGVGVLFIHRDVRFRPSMMGGGQENHRRAGTENIASIVALGVAAEQAHQHMSQFPGAHDPILLMRDRFERELLSRLPGISLNGSAAPRTPNTSNLRIENADAQGMILLLDQKGICCSAGSACNTGALHPSHVLAAMGLETSAARECLRFSFSRFNTDEEVNRAIDAVCAAAARLRGAFPTSK